MSSSVVVVVVLGSPVVLVLLSVVVEVGFGVLVAAAVIVGDMVVLGVGFEVVDPTTIAHATSKSLILKHLY